MWLIVRQPPMIAGWWDVPLAHQDLAEAISIIALKTALATVYFFNTFYLLEEMKVKCIFIIQNQIIMKTIIWRHILQNFNVNLKRLFWNGFGKSHCESDLRPCMDFKTWVTINVPPSTYFSSDPPFSKFTTESCSPSPPKPKGDWYYESKW